MMHMGLDLLLGNWLTGRSHRSDVGEFLRVIFGQDTGGANESVDLVRSRSASELYIYC